jgi:hypothetical protein
MPTSARSIARCLLISLTLLTFGHSELAFGSARARLSPLSAFVVSEAASGDLNGDGDAVDEVWHVYDARDAFATNVGLAASAVCRTSFSSPDPVCDAVAPVVDGMLAVLVVSEQAQGAADLNGDGDTGDDVLYAYDGRTGGTTIVPLALARALGRDVSSYIFPVPPVIAGDSIAFLVGEAEHGSLDLNGDGDVLDDVLHILDADTGAMVNTGFAAATVLGPFGSRNPISPVASGQKVTIVVGEAEQGGSDLNGDGDADDQVSIVIHVKNGKATVEKSHD